MRRYLQTKYTDVLPRSTLIVPEEIAKKLTYEDLQPEGRIYQLLDLNVLDASYLDVQERYAAVKKAIKQGAWDSVDLGVLEDEYQLFAQNPDLYNESKGFARAVNDLVYRRGLTPAQARDAIQLMPQLNADFKVKRLASQKRVQPFLDAQERQRFLYKLPLLLRLPSLQIPFNYIDDLSIDDQTDQSLYAAPPHSSEDISEYIDQIGLYYEEDRW